jgi:hypothetical protein
MSIKIEKHKIPKKPSIFSRALSTIFSRKPTEEREEVEEEEKPRSMRDIVYDIIQLSKYKGLTSSELEHEKAAFYDTVNLKNILSRGHYLAINVPKSYAKFYNDEFEKDYEALRGAHIVFSNAYVDREGYAYDGQEWGPIEVDQQIINNEGRPLLDYYYDKNDKKIKKYNTPDNKKHQNKNSGIIVPGISIEKRDESVEEYAARKHAILESLSPLDKAKVEQAIKTEGGKSRKTLKGGRRKKNRRTRSKK